MNSWRKPGWGQATGPTRQLCLRPLREPRTTLGSAPSRRQLWASSPPKGPQTLKY